MHRCSAPLLALALLLAPLPACALPASATEESIQSFGPEFFAVSGASDALTMVRRLPGFTLIEGDEDVRGYAGAVGNVLIDGKSPSSKQESVGDMLKRIPAESVERIELIRGSAPGVDLGQYSVVANIVRKRSPSRQLQVEAGAIVAEDGRLHPMITLEASRQGPNRRLQGSLALVTEIDDESGDGVLVTTKAGGAAETDLRRVWEVERDFRSNVDYETSAGAGELALRASGEHELSRSSTDRRDQTGIAYLERVVGREQLTSTEAGLQYRLPIGSSSRAEALLLQRNGWSRARERSEEEGENERLVESTDSSESLARLSLRHEAARLTFEGSAEGALNGLDGSAALTVDGNAVALPGSSAKVSEKRAEVAAGVTWRPRERITVDSSLRFETSGLRARSGEHGSRRSFRFLKPSIGTTITLSHADQLRLRTERQVDQLDFEDFIASTSLERDDVTAGAIELTPPQTWSLAATWEHRFWTDGALVLTLRREWIDDVLDRIVIVSEGETFDAVGNIGSATRTVAEADLTAPLDRVGLDGFLLKLGIKARRGRVRDPITGAMRRISEESPIEGSARISQDLLDGALSWGLDLTIGERERQYRFDEIRFSREGLAVAFHADYRPAADWRIRLEAVNLTSRTLVETRREYDGLRSHGMIEETERRTTRTTPTLLLTVRKSFVRSR